MERYDPTLKAHKALLEDWYWTLRDSRDLNDTFHHSCHTPALFQDHFSGSTGLLFVGQPFTATMWITPWFDGCEMGIWIKKGHRHSPSVIRELRRSLEGALSLFSVVLSCTVQERVEKLLLHLGFKRAGEVPEAWDGSTVRAFYLTKRMYDERQIKRQ